MLHLIATVFVPIGATPTPRRHQLAHLRPGDIAAVINGYVEPFAEHHRYQVRVGAGQLVRVDAILGHHGEDVRYRLTVLDDGAPSEWWTVTWGRNLERVQPPRTLHRIWNQLRRRGT